jgi:hypothetical protein
VVEDEVVEHDDASPPPERVHDPAVRLRVVADVVEGDVGPARRPLGASPDDGQVEPTL